MKLQAVDHICVGTIEIHINIQLSLDRFLVGILANTSNSLHVSVVDVERTSSV